MDELATKPDLKAEEDPNLDVDDLKRIYLEDLIEATLCGVARTVVSQQSALRAKPSDGGLHPPDPNSLDWPWNIVFGLIWNGPGGAIPLDGGGQGPAAKNLRLKARSMGKKPIASQSSPYCPSAQPCMEGSVVLGVVGGTAEEPHVAYLNKPQPVTEEILALTEPVKPTEVLRFASPCAAHACQHFDGSKCRLASRVVNLLPMAVDRLPPCHLRPKCRWWRQEGRAACMRCPIIVTETVGPSDLLRRTADPNNVEGLTEDGNE